MIEITTNTLVFFLLSISSSLIFYSYLADPNKTGAGFFKLIFSISSAGYFLGFISLVMMKGLEYKLSYFFLILSALALLLRTLQKDFRSLLSQVIQGIVILLSFYLCYLFLNSNIHSFILLLSSLLFVGIITYSMIMGHWYLVTPKLSAKPLLNATYITWALIALKVTTSIFYFFQFEELFASGTTLGAGYIFNWIMLIMRYVWGYLIVLAMSIFSYRLLKMRSLQSATGILYAETFFIFVGELISTYYFFSYGVLL